MCYFKNWFLENSGEGYCGKGVVVGKVPSVLNSLTPILIRVILGMSTCEWMNARC